MTNVTEVDYTFVFANEMIFYDYSVIVYQVNYTGKDFI